MIARRVTTCVLLLALFVLFVPSSVFAQSCGGLPGESRLLVDTYAASGTYVFSPTPDPAICYFFHSLGSATYTVTLGSANYPQTGDVYFTGNLFDGVITGPDAVELWQVLPISTPTATASATPGAGGCYTYTSSNVIVEEYGGGTASVVTNSAPFPYEIAGVYEPGVVFLGDFIGWTIVLHDQNLYISFNPGGQVHMSTNHTIAVNTVSMFPNGVNPFVFDLCPPVAPATITPTPTLTSTATPTFLPTATYLPTPLPNQGTCVLLGATNTGTQYLLHRSGDLFGYTFRISTPLGAEQTIAVDALAIDGTTVHNDINNNVFYAINRHTLYVDWSDSAFFGVQLCSGVTITPTRTPLPPFGTLTPSRTPTSTLTATPTPIGTLTPSIVPTSTPTRTPMPTPTRPSNCATPDNEDSGECALIDGQQTQIALELTMVAVPGTPSIAEIPTPTDISFETISTAIAAVCTKDPCYNLKKFQEIGTSSLDVFINADNNTCHAPSFPFEFGSGDFAIGSYMQFGFSKAVCWVIDVTTPIRIIMRALSVLGIFFMLWKYYIKTMRRLGDV